MTGISNWHFPNLDSRYPPPPPKKNSISIAAPRLLPSLVQCHNRFEPHSGYTRINVCISSAFVLSERTKRSLDGRGIANSNEQKGLYKPSSLDLSRICSTAQKMKTKKKKSTRRRRSRRPTFFDMGWLKIGTGGGRLWVRLMNLRVPWNAGNFLTSCKPVSFSKTTLHHGVSK